MSIIKHYHKLLMVELRPIKVDYDQTIEDMISGFRNYEIEPIISDKIPGYRRGKSGKHELSLHLINPIHCYAPWEITRMAWDEGFMPQSLPELSALKEHHCELYQADIEHIYAIYPAAVWVSDMWRHIPHFRTGEKKEDCYFRGHSIRLGDDELPVNSWIVCARS